jgi:ribosomal protein S18 acetylase RimI-like enzyme
MGVAIRTAGPEDRDLVVELLDAAFRHDPVSSWVLPGDDYRRRTHPVLMGAFTDGVMEAGRIDVTEDGTACALWIPVPAEGMEEDPEGAAAVRELVDPANERVEQIALLTGEIHPKGHAHEYLWMVAVAPEHQGKGLGAALIGETLDRCDREGLGAYLEASNTRSCRLYERLGFRYSRPPLELPDGPRMYPMWRDPRGSAPASA